MKKQSPLGYSPASYGYPTAPRTPLGARNGGGGSNLPSIFSKEPGGGLILQRPQSGLKLDVKGLNSTGFFLSNGARERPQKGLSSSDSTADRIRQVQKYHAMHTPRHHTSDGRLLHHSRGTQPVAAAESNSIREKGVTSFGGGALAPITRRQPSAVVEGRRRPGTLPPIGAESEECDSLVTVEEESLFGGLEAAGGDRENEDFDSVSDDSESDTDDEVILF